MARKQVTNMEVKKNNRNQIFRYLCKHDTVSNPDIAYALKISLPTVTQNTKELIERGLINAVGELESTGGRRAKALSVAANARLAVGIDITKNHVGFLLTNIVGEVLQYDRISQPYRDEEIYYRELNRIMEQFLDKCEINKENILGIGISFPGIVDLDRERIAYSHVLGVKLLTFQDVSQFFAYPCTFLNDANAGAYAEGLRTGITDRFFYLSLSNTVGGAIISERQLVQGSMFRCGEVGHMTIVPNGVTCYCGKKGCLDAYCSAKCLANLYGGKLEQFFEALKQKEKTAIKAWENYTDYLAIAVNNIHMLLDCEIILGGYVGSYAEPYIHDIWKKVEQRNTFAEEDIFIRPGKYKIETAALGAALNVIEAFIERV